MCSLGACHTPSGGGSRCCSTCLPDHPPPGLAAVQTRSPIGARCSFPFAVSTQVLTFALVPFSSPSFHNPFIETTQELHHFYFSKPLICYTCLVKRQKLLASVYLWRPKVSAFGHLMAWMGPPVSCSWPVPSDTVELRGLLPGTLLSPLASTVPSPACTLHSPPSSNSEQQRLSPTVCDVGSHSPASVSTSKGPTVNTSYSFRKMSCEIFSRCRPWGEVGWMWLSAR